MVNYIIVLVFQILFNIFKVYEIKYTYENRLVPLLINSVWINLISLSSVFFSLDRLFVGDFLIVPFFIFGSVIGKWLGMTKLSDIKLWFFKK
jgi:hypothetical protein